MSSDHGFIYSPFFVDSANDISYTYNDQEGLLSIHKSRAVLRARSVIAAAFMRGSIGYYADLGLLFYGELHRIIHMSRTKVMKNLMHEFQEIRGSNTANHIGYYVVPKNEHAGWGAHAGWAVIFLDSDVTVEHAMFDVYKMIKPAIKYLIKTPSVLENLTSARYSMLNSKQERSNDDTSDGDSDSDSDQ